ncbi:MAG: hypothetical protein ACRDVL_08045 [Acidimicrobiia bacterium]
MRPHPLIVLAGAAAVTIAACTGPTADPGGTDAPMPDQPRDGVGAMVDWEDTGKVVELQDGWTVHACEGDAPVLCVEREGLPVGVVEAIAYPVSSFDDLDPAADPGTNLRAFAQGFVEAIGADRAAGCGPEYEFQPIPVEAFVLGGTPGIAYGFVGTMPDGRSSELNLQYATIVGDQVLSIVAIAYDGGGCPGRDELSTFDSDTLADFRPHLESLLHESPLPELDSRGE